MFASRGHGERECGGGVVSWEVINLNLWSIVVYMAISYIPCNEEFKRCAAWVAGGVFGFLIHKMTV